MYEFGIRTCLVTCSIGRTGWKQEEGSILTYYSKKKNSGPLSLGISSLFKGTEIWSSSTPRLWSEGKWIEFLALKIAKMFEFTMRMRLLLIFDTIFRSFLLLVLSVHLGVPGIFLHGLAICHLRRGIRWQGRFLSRKLRTAFRVWNFLKCLDLTVFTLRFSKLSGVLWGVLSMKKLRRYSKVVSYLTILMKPSLLSSRSAWSCNLGFFQTHQPVQHNL